MILRGDRELILAYNYKPVPNSSGLLQPHPVRPQRPHQLSQFDHGTYPKISKHRWLVHTVPGYRLNINFNFVDVENGVDQIRVYSLNSNALKMLVTKVTSATTVSVRSSSVLITLSTTECGRHHRGFNATISVQKYDVTTKPKINLYFYN